MQPGFSYGEASVRGTGPATLVLRDGAAAPAMPQRGACREAGARVPVPGRTELRSSFAASALD